MTRLDKSMLAGIVVVIVVPILALSFIIWGLRVHNHGLLAMGIILMAADAAAYAVVKRILR